MGVRGGGRGGGAALCNKGYYNAQRSLHELKMTVLQTCGFMPTRGAHRGHTVTPYFLVAGKHELRAVVR